MTMKLTRLKIDKYRNVAPGTELRFNDGFNVLLGKNGTGKTTLLRLIAAIVRSDFSALKDDEFAISYDLSFAEVEVSVGVKNVAKETLIPDAPGARGLSNRKDPVRYDF